MCAAGANNYTMMAMTPCALTRHTTRHTTRRHALEARPAAAGPDLAKFWLVGSDIDGTFVAENPAGRTLPDVPPEANKQLYQHL